MGVWGGGKSDREIPPCGYGGHGLPLEPRGLGVGTDRDADGTSDGLEHQASTHTGQPLPAVIFPCSTINQNSLPVYGLINAPSHPCLGEEEYNLLSYKDNYVYTLATSHHALSTSTERPAGEGDTVCGG